MPSIPGDKCFCLRTSHAPKRLLPKAPVAVVLYGDLPAAVLLVYPLGRSRQHLGHDMRQNVHEAKYTGVVRIMKMVPQEDDTGCGAAVLAMVSGLTYQQARDALHPKYTPRRKTWFTSWKQLEVILKELGLLAGPRVRVRKLRDLKGPAIVRIKLPWHEKRHSHYVFWDGTGCVYDPADGGAIYDHLYRRHGFRIVSAQPVNLPSGGRDSSTSA